MSVKVDLEALADTLTNHDYAYLLTVSDDGRPHAVAVQPEMHEGRLRLGGLGSRTTHNVTERPDVTLVFPPREVGGYSLIVDARAGTHGDGTYVVPAHAVLHRPAAPGSAGATTEGSCGNDCVPLSS